MKKLIILLTLVPLLTLSCAGTRTSIYKGDEALFLACQAIYSTEVTLSNAGLLTPAQSLKIETDLRPVVAVAEKATIILRDWHSGPIPTELKLLIKDLGDLVQTIGSTLPDSPAKSTLLLKVADVQAMILSILSIVVGVS